MTDQKTPQKDDAGTRETYHPGDTEEAGLAHGGGGFGAKDLQRQGQPETGNHDA